MWSGRCGIEIAVGGLGGKIYAEDILAPLPEEGAAGCEMGLSWTDPPGSLIANGGGSEAGLSVVYGPVRGKADEPPDNTVVLTLPLLVSKGAQR